MENESKLIFSFAFKIKIILVNSKLCASAKQQERLETFFSTFVIMALA